MPAILRPQMSLASGHNQVEDFYLVLQSIGAGGICEVYLVDTPGRNYGPMAMKVAVRPSSVPNLYREGWWMKRNVPGVVPCHYSDFITVDGRCYPAILMPYMREGSMHNVIETMNYRVSDALSWLWSISTALEDLGVVHRDLKPENILFFANKPMVADFGLAIPADPTERQLWNESESVKCGTQQYMAPEQHWGTTPLDVRADIYSLGIILYELMTGFGHSLHQEPSENSCLANKQLQRFYSRSTGEPVIDDIVKKSTSYRRSARYQSHAEFRAALRHARRQIAANDRQIYD